MKNVFFYFSVLSESEWEIFVIFRTMQGGAETGFKHVLPEEYRPRLLHFSGKRRIEVKEVNLLIYQRLDSVVMGFPYTDSYI